MPSFAAKMISKSPAAPLLDAYAVTRSPQFQAANQAVSRFGEAAGRAIIPEDVQTRFPSVISGKDQPIPTVNVPAETLMEFGRGAIKAGVESFRPDVLATLPALGPVAGLLGEIPIAGRTLGGILTSPLGRSSAQRSLLPRPSSPSGFSPESVLIPAERPSVSEAAGAAREGFETFTRPGVRTKSGLSLEPSVEGAERLNPLERIRLAKQFGILKPSEPASQRLIRSRVSDEELIRRQKSSTLTRSELQAGGQAPAEIERPLPLPPSLRGTEPPPLKRGLASERGYVEIPEEEPIKKLGEAAAKRAAAGALPGTTPQEQSLSARVIRVRDALKAARPIRREQERLFRQERGKRLARVLAVREKTTGERGFFRELGQLKGELPKAQFESLRSRISQQDIDGLFNDINASSLNPWDQISAKTGLSKLFGQAGGGVPQKGELDLLREVFGPGLVEDLMKKRPLLQKAADLGLDIANLPKALMASVDLSAPLRQGVFLVGRPKQWIPAFGSMFRQFLSKKAFQESNARIQARPNFSLMREAKLAITDLGQSVTDREESFMSRLAGKIPGVASSARAYTGFLNRLRADVFDDIISKAKRAGVSVDDPRFLSSLGNFINTATGRGPLGVFERSAVILNTAIFSPRLLSSRLSLLNPMFYVGLEPTVRKEALGSLLSFVSLGASVLGLAKLAGVEVSADPRNADFGKIKIGNTRYDIFGGFQQPIVGITRMITGEMVSSTTGREFTLGEGFKPTTRLDILMRFLQSKQAPILSFVTTLLRGQTGAGQPVRVPVEVAERFVPMFISDVFEVMQEQGNGRWWMALPGLFGVGVQTYGKNIPFLEQTETGRETIRFRQEPSLSEHIVNRITGTQLSNIPEQYRSALEQARIEQIKRDIELDRAKKLVLETGKSMKVGNSVVYLQDGIVKVLTPKGLGAPSPMKTFQQIRVRERILDKTVPRRTPVAVGASNFQLTSGGKKGQ